MPCPYLFICQISKTFFVFYIVCFKKENQIWKKDSVLYSMKTTGEIWLFCFIFCSMILSLVEITGCDIKVM